MGRFVKGDIVVAPFPFSDLSASKRRPAMVLGVPSGDDILLCQITSQASRDTTAIPLSSGDFAAGGLPRPSYIRPDRLFTADSHIIAYVAGHVSAHKRDEVIEAVVTLLRA